MQLRRCRCRPLRGVCLFAERAQRRRGGACRPSSAHSVSHSPLRRHSDRRQPPFKVNGCAHESCNLPEFAKCTTSRREQRQRGKHRRNTKLLAAASTLAVRLRVRRRARGDSFWSLGCGSTRGRRALQFLAGAFFLRTK